MDELAAQQAPMVSVLMPTLNRVDTVVDAARSVLAQEYGGDLELIVIDNGSTDGTVDAIAGMTDPRVRLVREPRRGVGFALNRGLGVARGAVIGRNDSDDLWLPHLLSTLVPELVRPDGPVAVYGRAQGFASTGVALPEFRGQPFADPSDPLATLLLSDCTSSITTLIRRTDLEAVGGWSARDWSSEDWDMALRLATHGRLCFIDALVARFRRHDGNMTMVGSDRMAERLALRRVMLDRAFERLAPDAVHHRLRRVAYRNLFIGEGHQYLQGGALRPAFSAYRESLSLGDPVGTLARLAWTGTLWFGPGWVVSLGDRLLRFRRRLARAA